MSKEPNKWSLLIGAGMTLSAVSAGWFMYMCVDSIVQQSMLYGCYVAGQQARAHACTNAAFNQCGAKQAEELGLVVKGLCEIELVRRGKLEPKYLRNP